ncbi:histone deacetylase 14, chloroplastic-like isoform X3 [Rutidosis leptorrhynchoides]|uniref:histone deacetylase 14, chloroplastic-like isoform X3 n=1 Tax=Rutidosis leptorrhynchoides TaxID=125765 RepID=UPI003A994265
MKNQSLFACKQSVNISVSAAFRRFLYLRTKCGVASSSKPATKTNDNEDDMPKVIYSLGPAMGHNRYVYGIDSNSRIRYILNALEDAKLTPEFRGSKIKQLTKIRKATLEEITSVHSRSYYSFLEKTVEDAKASEDGLIEIEKSKPLPTYVTGTTLNDSLIAAGTGLSLVDAVDGCYPVDTGRFDDIGSGNGEGATLNLPLPQLSGDVAMRTAFDEVIVPCAQRFKPDMILVSAGYDGHHLEGTSDWQMTTRISYPLAYGIKQLAEDLCGGHCVFFLEGGWRTDTLKVSIEESFRAFIGEPSIANNFEKQFDYWLKDEPSSQIKQAIQRVKNLHSL